jgi:hypothetical protein
MRCGCPPHVGRGAFPLNDDDRGGGPGGGDGSDGARARRCICNCRAAPVRAPFRCLRNEGDIPVRLKIAGISECIDTGLRCPRVWSMVVVAAQNNFATFDEYGSEGEAHRALGSRIGTLPVRELKLRVVHDDGLAV